MTDYIEWEGRLFRRKAVDYVSRYGPNRITVFFASGKEGSFTLEGNREAKFSELVQKVAGTWLEDTREPQDGTETGPGAFVVESWGEITAGNS